MLPVNKRLATLAGCNNYKSPYELHGCINDVQAMRKVLMSRFGFDRSHIEVLTDECGSRIMPTGANIRATLGRMVDRAKPGDVLLFYFSGHGNLIPDPRNGSKQDEVIIPCDWNLITDVDFRRLVNRLPEGASFTIISDSCHSGGLIDKEKEQIGPHAPTNSRVPRRVRTIPFDSILHHLTTLSGITSAHIAPHLFKIFGRESSAKFHPPGSKINTSRPLLKPDDGILLSGCQANERSAEIGVGTKACGAFSNAIQLVLKGHAGPLSNRQVVMLVREELRTQGKDKQNPCLYCSDKNADAPFLGQPGM